VLLLSLSFTSLYHAGCCNGPPGVVAKLLEDVDEGIDGVDTGTANDSPDPLDDDDPKPDPRDDDIPELAAPLTLTWRSSMDPVLRRRGSIAVGSLSVNVVHPWCDLERIMRENLPRAEFGSGGRR
jgi:hypothetical protein